MLSDFKNYNIDKLTSYNTPSFIEKTIRLFIKLTHEYFVNMDMAIKESDLIRINQLAHFIKPSADLLSINSISQSIKEIELASEINTDLIHKIDFTKQQLKIATQQMVQDYM
jgi:HPt (histidine-containing phosphotransfer) domain-containing protein